MNHVIDFKVYMARIFFLGAFFNLVVAKHLFNVNISVFYDSKMQTLSKKLSGSEF